MRRGPKAGFDGSISGTLVNKMRAQLGLTGNLRSSRRRPRRLPGPSPTPARSGAGNRRGSPPRRPGDSEVETRGRKSARTLRLNELEADIDRLVFKVMGHRRPSRDRGFAPSGQAAPLREADPGLSGKSREPDSMNAGAFPGVFCWSAHLVNRRPLESRPSPGKQQGLGLLPARVQ